MIWTAEEFARFLDRYRGRVYLGSVECGDCVEFVFADEQDGPNLLTLFRRTGKAAHGGVADPARYVRDADEWKWAA